MVGLFVLRSFDRRDRLHAAMQARGYEGTIRFTEDRPLGRPDCLLFAVALILLAGLVLYARQ